MLRFCVWYVLAGCLCNLSISTVAGAPASNYSTLKIGALLDFNSSIAMIAMKTLQLAIENINKDPKLFKSVQLELEMFNTDCDPVHGASSAVELLKSNVVAIVGPQCSNVAHFVAQIGSNVRVPIVSFGATDPSLSEQQYNFLARIAPSDGNQMEAVADFIYNYGWKLAAAIYTDDDYGTNGIVSLRGSLQKRGSRIVESAVFPPSTSGDSIREELIRLRDSESRVFVLHTDRIFGFQILREAYNLSMIDTGYVWIVTDQVANALVRPNQDPSFLETFQGLIGTRRYLLSSPQANDLLAQLQQRYPTDMKGIGIDNINAYGVYAYDAMYTVAYAISKHLEQRQNFSFIKAPELPVNSGGSSELENLRVLQSGSALRKNIFAANFQGASGFIKFDAAGDIKDVAYEYVNVVGHSTQVVGYWVNQTNVSTAAPFLLNGTMSTVNSTSNSTNLHVLWPGGSTITPEGWALPKNGGRLRIGVPIKAGYAEVLSQTVDAKNVTKYNGLCIQVFETAVSSLGYPVPYDYIPIRSKDLTKVNPDYDELVGMVAKKELDAAVGDIIVTADRLKIVDFTQPFIESGLVVLVPRRSKHEKKMLAFLRPFTAAMWAMIFAATVLVAIVMRFLEREEFGQHGILKVLLFSFSTLFSDHRENTNTFLGRIVVLVWLFVVLIVNSSYTANLTAILTVEQLTPDIQGLESLLKTNVHIGYQTGSFAYQYLLDLKVSRDRLTDFSNLESFKKALHNGTIGAVVDELPYVEMFLEDNCADYAIAGPEFTKSGWGFAFPRGSEIVSDLSEAIIQMSQRGDIAKLQKYWFKDLKCEDPGGSTETVSNQLNVDSFWFLFSIMVGVSAIAVVIAFIRNRLHGIPGTTTNN